MPFSLHRRRLLATAVAAGLPRFSWAQTASAAFDTALRQLQAAPDAVLAAHAYADYAEADASARCENVLMPDGKPLCIVSNARRPGRLKPSAAPVSARAKDLIVFCEVTSKDRYARQLDHPVWPNLQSGVTIGIGYDLGYVGTADFTKEWGTYLHPFTLQALTAVVGKRGEDAHKALADVDYLKIDWDDAYRQFTDISLPVFTAETERFCDNTNLLSPDSRGALVSLVINRGSSLAVGNDSQDRRREMREIAGLMKDRNFAAIPAKFIEMTRLWRDIPAARGLILRRQAEAALFQAGLA